MRSLLNYDSPAADPLEQGLDAGMLADAADAALAGDVRAGLHVRCPHCRNPIELIDIDTEDDLQLAEEIIQNNLYDFGLSL